MARSNRNSKVTTVKPSRRLTASKSTRDTTLERLIRRIGNLTLAYVAAGRATPVLQTAVVKLKVDIDAWRDHTGRRDLRAISKMQKQKGDGTWTCKQCECVMISLRMRSQVEKLQLHLPHTTQKPRSGELTHYGTSQPSM